jgi:CMP/dCMP kinase
VGGAFTYNHCANDSSCENRLLDFWIVSSAERKDLMEIPKRGPERLEQQCHGLVIAIDGPAGAGKSTVARILAQRLGFQLLDTGALYRVMALHLLRHGVALEAEHIPQTALTSLDLRMEADAGSMKLFLGAEEVTHLIRDEHTGAAASVFSTKPAVRQALLGLQRSAREKWNLVAEGRDMGTVVFPDAAVKFFVTADLGVRSKRRYLELLSRGEDAESREVLNEMRARDHRDESRAVSPLVKASDAICIDTTNLAQGAVVDEMMSHIEQKLAGAGECQ